MQKIRQGGFVLILLDMMMPKLDGLGVMNDLALNPPLAKNGPVILLSNIGDESLVEETLKKGAVAYITKADIIPDKLLETIGKYIDS